MIIENVDRKRASISGNATRQNQFRPMSWFSGSAPPFWELQLESNCCIGLSVIYNLSFSGSRWCFHYLGWKLFQYDSTLLSYCQLSLMGGFIDFPIRGCRFKSDTFWLFVHYGGWFPFMRRIPFFVLGYSFQCVPFQSHFIRYYIMDPDHFCN